jgi:S-adenosylmethionine:tRNA ribosyltransferase-isomerase
VKTEDFSFELPEELIAQVPPERRGESRLLVLDRADGSRIHASLGDIPSFVEPGSLMIFNDSRVRKARLFGTALDSAGEAEFLLLRRLDAAEWEAATTKLRRQRPGRRYVFPEGVIAEIRGPSESGDTRILRFEPPIDETYLERNGHIPLPPYIRRGDGPSDAERYQTIFAKTIGSAASPTAGLHFTEAIMGALEERGISVATVTLHVGLGTFLPVRAERVEEHAMHEEEYEVPASTAAAVDAAKADGRPVVAVGTTSLRTLESAWAGEGAGGGLAPGPGRTRIFIYPGYRFKVATGLFTNFHTPRSTLLMLVSAFAGRERVLSAYAEAVRMRYRFFSYGDAMLIR